MSLLTTAVHVLASGIPLLACTAHCAPRGEEEAVCSSFWLAAQRVFVQFSAQAFLELLCVGG